MIGPFRTCDDCDKPDRCMSYEECWKAGFRAVLSNPDDQVIVRQLLAEMVPDDVQAEIVRRFNDHARRKEGLRAEFDATSAARHAGTAGRWTTVDRPPPGPGDYIGLHEEVETGLKVARPACFDAGGWRTLRHVYDHLDLRLTHWMPIPGPPRSGEEA
jgi:hypothetical protein